MTAPSKVPGELAGGSAAGRIRRSDPQVPARDPAGSTLVFELELLGVG